MLIRLVFDWQSHFSIPRLLFSMIRTHMVTHTCNPGNWETEAEGLQAQSQPGLKK